MQGKWVIGSMKKFHSICVLDFSEILCDGRHSKESKSDLFQDNFDYT